MQIPSEILNTILAGIFGLIAGIISSYIAKRKDISDQYLILNEAMKKLMDEKEELWKARLEDAKKECADRIDALEKRLSKYEKLNGS